MSEAYIGEIRLFAGSYAPQNWAICDGSLLPISNNEALFSLLGTLYGGNGVSTFGLPDYRGRVVIGQGAGPNLTPRALAQTLGTETVTITPANTPAHTHNFVVNPATATSPTPDPTNTQTFGAFTSSGLLTGLYSAETGTAPAVALNSQFLDQALVPPEGAVVPHKNMMGSLAINYIICLMGNYPPQP